MKVLGLNKNYVPISIITMKKALLKVCSKRAEMVYLENGVIVCCDIDEWFRLKKPLPCVIRFLNYTGEEIQSVVLTKKNLFIRDDYLCQYCGKEVNKEDIQMEHIIPRSSGGETIWKNVVSSCKSCNEKKSDRTPKQAGMKLLSEPYKPTFFEVNISNFKDEKYSLWEFFIKSKKVKKKTKILSKVFKVYDKFKELKKQRG